MSSRSFFLALAPLALASGLFGQSAVLTCATSAVPPAVRSEGITERTGDILLSCSGGQPGAQVSGNIIVSLSVNVTNKILADGTLDATLNIDTGGGSASTMAARQYTTNAVAFNGVVFNLSPEGKADLRIVNLRGNASQPGFQTNSFITASISFTGAGISVPNSVFIVAVPQRGLLAASTGKIFCGPSGSPLPDTLNFNNLLGNGTVYTTTRVTEGFASAFAPLNDPASLRADSGTRFIARYSGFPVTARLFVPDVVVGSSADVPTSSGDMGLPASGGQYTAGKNQLLLVRLTGADATGAGGRLVTTAPFSGTATFNTVGELAMTGGSGYAVYEVVDANPFVREWAQFPTFLGLPPNAVQTTVETDGSVNFAAVSNVFTQSSTAWIPRFIDTPPAGDCSAVGDCNARYYPKFEVDVTPIQIAAAVGQPVTRYVPVRNAGQGVLRWTATVQYPAASAQNWVRLDTSQGVNNGTIRLDIVSANLQPGTYSAVLTIDGGPLVGAQTIPITLTLTSSGQQIVAAPAVASVTNAADYETTALVPGSLGTVIGQRFKGANVQVTFDGTPATILYMDDKQINLQVPSTMAGKQTAQMVITVDGNSSAPKTVQLATAAPAIFAGAVLNEDYGANGESRPAQAGRVMQIFATGLPANGVITAKVHDITIALPNYGGPAPGFPGVQQVNVLVPDYLPTMQTYVYVCGGATVDQQVCSPAQKIWIAGR